MFPMNTQETSGGAIIADRFKLDTVPTGPNPGDVGKGLSVAALSAALAALAAVGAVAGLMYAHWDAIAGA